MEPASYRDAPVLHRRERHPDGLWRRFGARLAATLA
jgi:hypothetical protein